MDLLAKSAILLSALLAMTVILHVVNIRRVHKRIEDLGCKTTREDFYKDMTISVGSNFCALANVAWILAFVAAAYLFFLVPIDFPYSFSFMQVPVLASNPLGFFFFGTGIAIIATSAILFLDKLPKDRRELKLTEVYSFYTLSKGMKKAISLTILALSISILFSAYAGTIYPARDPRAEAVAMVMLAVSMLVLFLPIYRGAWEGLR